MLPSLGPVCLSLFSLFSAVRARSSTGDPVLVLLQPHLSRDNFTIFFDNLESYGLTFRVPKAETPRIIIEDESFNHIIIFVLDTRLLLRTSRVTPQSLVTTLNAGTNLIVVLSSKQTPIFTLASEFSLILPPPETPLISHFLARDTPPGVIPVSVPPAYPLLTPNTPPIWFSGIPFAHGNNPLLVPILHAPAESFASDADSDASADAFNYAERGGEGLWGSSSLCIVGGVELFSDEYANKPLLPKFRSAHLDEKLVLRIDSITYHLVNETEPREHYTINENIVRLH
ncbi:Dolichyl-diphosphooligosaccharide--protein glycosyltransferase subunit WBP1 [Lactarius hatsudake]|nr:Dolichyl-diphosphooligosaccharide--protein glycosyltransferase subunit WBP1 [Lactarius hatsudake]